MTDIVLDNAPIAIDVVMKPPSVMAVDVITSPVSMLLDIHEYSGPPGPKGDTGSQGPKGDTGPQGPPGLDAPDVYVNTTGDTMTGPLGIFNSVLNGYSSGGAQNDSLRVVSNNAGAGFGVQNSAGNGYSGIEYIDNGGSVRVFTGYNNGNPGEFRFNNIAGPAAQIVFKLNGNNSIALLSGGNVSYYPIILPTNPIGPMEAATKQYVDSIWVQLTQAEYDALNPPNPNTLYVVVG